MTDENETNERNKREFQNFVKTRAMPNSDKDDFHTPQPVFDALNERFGPFTLDAAASADNALVAEHYDTQANSLEQDWTGRVWCNPPYVRGEHSPNGIIDWVRKAWDSVESGQAELVAMLIPAYISNYYWHDTVFPNASHLVIFRARLNFKGPYAVTHGASRQASVCVVFQHCWSGVGIQVLRMSNRGEWLTEETWDRELLEIRLTNGVLATGMFLDNNQFVVQAGSTANLEPRPSWRTPDRKIRARLEAEGALFAQDDETLVFTRDVTFKSPSAAASIVRAVNSNGQKLWKSSIPA